LFALASANLAEIEEWQTKKIAADRNIILLSFCNCAHLSQQNLMERWAETGM
jgi:hypothetical protein